VCVCVCVCVCVLKNRGINIRQKGCSNHALCLDDLNARHRSETCKLHLHNGMCLATRKCLAVDDDEQTRRHVQRTQEQALKKIRVEIKLQRSAIV
jgi:hypothetical protein